MYERIRELRENKILSQQKVADYLQCDQRTYSSYERGKTTIPPEVLIKLAKLHDTTVDYLLRINDRKMICVDGLTAKQTESVKVIVSDLISGNNRQK